MLQPKDCIELIIIDDGSTDDTSLLCNKYRDKIRYFRTDNLGTGHARNFGLEQAKGTWIMYLDADDLYLLDSLNEEFINCLSNYEQQDVDIVFTPCSYTDIHLNQWIKTENTEEQFDVISKYTFWNGIYRHAFLLKNDIRFYEYKEQDIESAFRYLTCTNAQKTVANNEMKFYLQRENNWGNTHTWDLKKVSEIKTLVYYDLFKNHANSVKNRDWLLKELLNAITFYFMAVYQNGFGDKGKYIQVCNIVKECLFTNEARRILGKKQYIKETIRFIRCRLFAKERIETDQIKTNETYYIDSSDAIIERLRTISDFVR